MKMSRLILFLTIVAGWSNPVHGDEAAIRKDFAAYVEAFNKQDAAGVSALWSEKAMHTDRETGERTDSGKAIVDDIVAGFKTSPKAILAGHIDRIRMIRPDVASVEGGTTLSSPDSEPTVSVFSAIVVATENKWQIDSIEESAAAVPASATAALSELEWLIGEWTDESEAGKVKTTWRWSANQAFLLRSFVVENDEGVEQEGTQVIGWDPRAQQIRSWSFNSDGSFGDGTWSKNGEEWLIKSSQTTSSGGAASGTYVLARVDENTVTLQLVGHEVDGEPLPGSEAVTAVRVKETAPAAKPQSDKR